jgi:hypothetical protein
MGFPNHFDSFSCVNISNNKDESREFNLFFGFFATIIIMVLLVCYIFHNISNAIASLSFESVGSIGSLIYSLVLKFTQECIRGLSLLSIFFFTKSILVK